MNDLIEKVVELIVNAKRIVVFVGAGLSTESGIPDFRSPGGVWDKYDPEDFYYQNFLSSETSREKYWQMATDSVMCVSPSTKYGTVPRLFTFR